MTGFLRACGVSVSPCYSFIADPNRYNGFVGVSLSFEMDTQ